MFTRLAILLSSFAAWGLRAQVEVTMTIRPIWKARVNWLLRPFHQAINRSRGDLPQSSRDRTKTASIRMTQNTKESGMIFSAAKLNFLLIRQSRVPWEAERDLVCSDMGSLPFSLNILK